jgi:3-oxoacyl-[acyl-carrier protein] reductase
VREQFGKIDILVNDAGIQGPIGLFEELPPEEFTYTLKVNFLGPVWLCQAVVPEMKRRGEGVIINLSGGGAASPRERFTPYGAAKAALVRFTETAAMELAPYGVRVNAVAPGAVNTRMLEEVERAGERAGPGALEEVRKQRETGGTRPELAAELVVFLASDGGRQISGKLISAVWDDWRALQDGSLPMESPEWFTLRRVAPPKRP